MDKDLPGFKESFGERARQEDISVERLHGKQDSERNGSQTSVEECASGKICLLHSTFLFL